MQQRIIELMLATPYDKVVPLEPPYLVQPKLNGFRAYWDGECLASRNQVIWSRKKLPELYEKLEKFSAEYPDIVLDGELYCHGMARQDISKRVSGANKHLDRAAVEFHVFDIIDDELGAEDRLLKLLSTKYEPFVAVARVETIAEVDSWLKRFVDCGFEGLMLRVPDAKYEHGRSASLIKLKPWQYGTGIVIDTTAGEGKYKGMIGALVVRAGNVQFKVSGGLSDRQRSQDPRMLKGIVVKYKYRELSNSGKPLEPQLC